MERVLSAYTGEPWKVGTLTWSLGGKLHIYGLTCELGDGAFEVEHIQVEPNFQLLLQKKLRFSEVVVTSPSLEVSDRWLIEKLAEKASGQTAPQREQSGPLIANQSEESTEPGLSNEAGDTLAKENTEAANPLPTSKKIAVKANRNVIDSKNHNPEDEFESWIKVVDANLSVKTQLGNLMELHDLDLEIPIGGRDLTGRATWGGINLLGRQVLEQGAFNLEKNGSVISVKETEVDFFGIKLQPDVYLGRAPTGMVFHIDMQIPEQSVEEMFTHLSLTMDLSAEKLGGRMQLAGELASPLTWQAIADVRAAGVELVEGHRGTMAQFDSFVFGAALKRGVLQLPHLQLRGDEVSMMSNGVLTMNGNGFGIVRLITSPEKTDWVNKLTQGSHFFEGERGSLMQPLETNDLYLMDVKLDGNLLNPMMQVDGRTAWQPLWPAIGRMRKFVKEERLEE